MKLHSQLIYMVNLYFWPLASYIANIRTAISQPKVGIKHIILEYCSLFPYFCSRDQSYSYLFKFKILLLILVCLLTFSIKL